MTPHRLPERLRPATLAAFALLAVAAPAARAQVSFTDVSTDLGLIEDFYRCQNAHGLGVTWIDFNEDGWPDLFLINGKGEKSHLWQNLGDGTFLKVDELLPALPDIEMMGSIFGDYDNDGDSDLYVFTDNEIRLPTADNPGDGPPNILLRNLWVENGGGIIEGQPLFEDVAVAAGVDDLADPPLGTTYTAYRSPIGGWLDYDRDGWLDLYVGPWWTDHPGEHGNEDRLFRNNGDGTFSDVTDAAGIYTIGDDPNNIRPILAFIAAHLDDDLWPDLWVSNVMDPLPFHQDIIYRNNGDGTFTDVTANSPGVGDDTEADMGITIGDIDLDGDFDVYISDLLNTTLDAAPLGNPLFLNNGDGTFQDNTADLAGVTSDSSWGVNFFDSDLDGFEDLYVGTINHQNPDEFFLNNGDGTFTEMGVAAGVDDGGNIRGSAVADYDRDGDLDLAAISQGGRLHLFRNDTPRNDRHWLEVRLDARVSNRDAIGALVKATVGTRQLLRQVVGGYGAHSQDELVLHFGVGDATQVDALEVSWPSGAVSILTAVAVDQLVEVTERFVATTGLYDRDATSFAFRHTNTSGDTESQFDVAVDPGDWEPLAGDWDGDGIKTVGLYEKTLNEFRLWESNSEGDPTYVFQVTPGSADWLPLAGDWDGDGREGVGLYNTLTNEFRLWNGLAGGDPDLTFTVTPETATWKAVAGDWDGDGVDTVARWHSDDKFYRLTNTPGSGDTEISFKYGGGNGTFVPVAGDYNADGVDSIGLYRVEFQRFALKNTNAAGAPDIVVRISNPPANAAPITGPWLLPTPPPPSRFASRPQS